MSQRKKPQQRCNICLMKSDLCICALIPKISCSTKIIFITTKREIQVPTNTARLTHLALTNSALLVRGDLSRTYDLKAELSDHGSTLLVYPSDDAPELTSEFLKDLKYPLTLIFPDGNWRQTSKMRKRDPDLSKMPVVKIPVGYESKYLVRRESKDGGLATIEAVARALGVIEGGEVQESLEKLLNEMTSRVLKSRGVRK